MITSVFPYFPAIYGIIREKVPPLQQPLEVIVRKIRTYKKQVSGCWKYCWMGKMRYALFDPMVGEKNHSLRQSLSTLNRSYTCSYVIILGQSTLVVCGQPVFQAVPLSDLNF